MERLFSGIPSVRFPPSYIHGPLDDDSTLSNYHTDQQILCEWLARIAADGRAAVDKQMAREINAAVMGVGRHYSFQLAERRRPEWQLKMTYTLRSVYECCALAVTLLLDERHGLASRLAQCTAPECGRFSLSLGGMGRSRKFCNDRHKQQADIARAAAERRIGREARRRGEQLSAAKAKRNR